MLTKEIVKRNEQTNKTHNIYTIYKSYAKRGGKTSTTTSDCRWKSLRQWVKAANRWGHFFCISQVQPFSPSHFISAYRLFISGKKLFHFRMFNYLIYTLTTLYYFYELGKYCSVLTTERWKNVHSCRWNSVHLKNSQNWNAPIFPYIYLTSRPIFIDQQISQTP